MLDLGGEAKRKELYAKVNAKVFTQAFESMTIESYSTEEAKVAKFGDIGQGENLTAAKAAAQQKKTTDVKSTAKK